MNRRALVSTLATALVLVLAALLPQSGVAQPPTALRLMTGPQGGSWIPLGGAIAEMVQKEMPGVAITVQPGAGIANVKAVEAGKADLGFGNANSTADAIAGRKPFDAPARNVRHLLTLYNQYFQIAVPEDSGIKTVADLKGKRIATQQVGNTGEQITREVLQVHGLTYNDMGKVNFVNYTDAVEMIKNRQADAFCLITTIPASSVMDLATGRTIRLLGLDEEKIKALNRLNAGYARVVIPRGTYAAQGADVVTIGTYTHIVASAALPDKLVHDLAAVMVKHKDALAAVVRDIAKTSPRDMGRDIGLPTHPGAQQYFARLGS